MIQEMIYEMIQENNICLIEIKLKSKWIVDCDDQTRILCKICSDKTMRIQLSINEIQIN